MVRIATLIEEADEEQVNLAFMAEQLRSGKNPQAIYAQNFERLVADEAQMHEIAAMFGMSQEIAEIHTIKAGRRSRMLSQRSIEKAAATVTDALRAFLREKYQANIAVILERPEAKTLIAQGLLSNDTAADVLSQSVLWKTIPGFLGDTPDMQRVIGKLRQPTRLYALSLVADFSSHAALSPVLEKHHIHPAEEDIDDDENEKRSTFAAKVVLRMCRLFMKRLKHSD